MHHDGQPVVAAGGAASRIASKARSRIFCEGDPPDGFHLILSGSVEVLQAAPTGASVRIATLGGGEYFGETALLSSSASRRASAFSCALRSASRFSRASSRRRRSSARARTASARRFRAPSSSSARLRSWSCFLRCFSSL